MLEFGRVGGGHLGGGLTLYQKVLTLACHRNPSHWRPYVVPESVGRGKLATNAQVMQAETSHQWHKWSLQETSHL